MKPKTANDIKIGDSLEIKDDFGMMVYVDVVSVRKTEKMVVVTYRCQNWRKDLAKQIRLRKTTEVMII